MSSLPANPRTNSTPLPSASRSNPISLRIYKALGTNFDDPASREALEIASSFYVPTAQPSASSPEKGKGRALPPELEEDPDDDDLGGISNGLWKRSLRGTTASDGSAARARKYLKRDVEAKLAEGSQAFLEAFTEVDEKLDVLRQHMQEMQVRCEQVQAELDQANSGTKYLLERADGLRQQRATAQLRQSLITLFLVRFTLSAAELASLTSRDIAVGPSVFEALDKVHRIRKDCYALLSGTGGKEQAGMDIMASTGGQLEAGYRKIHRWITSEFRGYGRDAQLEVSGVMREGMRRLRERPALLRDALHELTTTRHAALLQSFLDALTRGGPNGLPRPIELHAHDPTRYVGDMLAWVHQATASEHEFLLSLWGMNSKRMVGQARDLFDEDDESGAEDTAEGSQENGGGQIELGDDGVGMEEDGEYGEDGAKEKVMSTRRMVRESLDKDLEGLGRPLKQTIKSQEGIIMAYKIANLLQFYLVTMHRTIGSRAALCETIQEIYNESYAAFLETLDAHGRSLLRFLHPPDTNLTPPLALRDTCSILREILTLHSTSLVDPADHTEDFSLLLSKAVDPAVEMIDRMAEMRKSTGSAWERDIFSINCLGYLENALLPFDFASEQNVKLEGMVSRHVESMTFEHHGNLLEQCGLAPIMKTIRTRPPDTPLSRLPTTNSKALTAALSQFSTFLSSLDVLSSPRLALLTSTTLATQIHRTALAKISAAYGEVCERVLDKKEGYEFAETLLRRGREEVAVALGVGEGDEVGSDGWMGGFEPSSESHIDLNGSDVEP